MDDAKNWLRRAKNSRKSLVISARRAITDVMRRYELDPWAGAALGGVASLVLAAALVPLREDLTGSTLALLLVLPVLLDDGWKRKERA